MAERRKLTRRDWVSVAVGAIAFSAISVGIRNCRREQQKKREAWERRRSADPARDEASREIQDWLEREHRDGEPEQ